MDRRKRDIERRWRETGDPALAEALRQQHKRCALFHAGDHVRLDASRVEDTPEHLVGNFRVLTARTDAGEGRSYALVRLGAETVEDENAPERRVYRAEDQVTLTEYDLAALVVSADHPLTFEGEPVETLPPPLHTQVRARARETALDGAVRANPRHRRTRRPDLTVDVPSINTDLGIFIRPKVRRAPAPVAAEPADDEVATATVEAEPVIEEAPLATEVIAGLTKSRRRRRRGRPSIPELGHPETECLCACHLALADIVPGSRCECLDPGNACDAGRLA